MTSPTASLTIVFHFFFCTENSLFKAEIYPILEIISLTRSVWITSRATAKEARKDIFEATKTRAIKATEAACTAAKATIGARCAVLVIGRPLLLIAQRFISLLDFLIFIFRPRLLIDIWVIFFR